MLTRLSLVLQRWHSRGRRGPRGCRGCRRWSSGARCGTREPGGCCWLLIVGGYLVIEPRLENNRGTTRASALNFYYPGKPQGLKAPSASCYYSRLDNLLYPVLTIAIGKLPLLLPAPKAASHSSNSIAQTASPHCLVIYLDWRSIMSLFGTSPPGASQSVSNSQSKSLFGDDASAAPTPSSSSLFADNNSNNNDASPWSMPTPKKAARRELVKNLLPAIDVPESYIDSYDTVLESKDRVGAGIGLTGIKNILASSGLSAADQTKILNFVVPGGQETVSGLSRSEFNVLLALIGLGQEGDDITLDGVDERRKSMIVTRFADG